MTDLRKAAEMALEVLEELQFINASFLKCDKAAEALRQVLAQPEQEPVAGMFEEKLPDQNPPPWMRNKTGGPDDTKWEAYIKAPSVSSNEDWISLYTAPPKREWVWLTVEEMLDCWEQTYEPGHREYVNAMNMSRAVQVKSKEKNT